MAEPHIEKAYTPLDPRYTIAVDFDGVLHSYTSPFEREDVIPDPPVPGAIEWLADMTRHFDVVIHTARLSPPYSKALTNAVGQDSLRGRYATGPVRVREAMIAWFVSHGLTEVRNLLSFSGKPKALVYIDDRGYRFTGANFPTRDQIHRELRPWTKKD